MRKLYDEFFYVPKQGNVREKVLVARVAVSVALILLCMAIMNFTAYAYFSCNVSSGINTIQSARYDLDIDPPTELASTVDNGLDENDWTDVYVLDNSGNTENKTFSFTLTKSKDATAKVGYCKIEIKTDVNDASNKDDVQCFYTKPIGTYVENGTPVTADSRNVKIVVAANKTATVTFVAEWGTCGETPIGEEQIKPEYKESTSTKEANSPAAGSADTSQQSLDSLGTSGTGTTGTGTSNTGTSVPATPATETPSAAGTADTNQPDSSNSASSSSSSSVGQDPQSSDNKAESDTETDTNQQ